MVKIKSYQEPSYVDKLIAKLPGGFSESPLYQMVVSRIGKKRLSKPSLDGLDFGEIPFNETLKAIPAESVTDVLSFVGYVNDTKDRTFHIKGMNLAKGEETVNKIPYVHRWTEVYRRGLLAKLYQLEEHLGSDCSEVTMITLTVYQAGFTPEQCLLKLMDNYKKLLDVMRHKFNKGSPVDYYYILEPHKTGYPHMHIMYMKMLTDDQKEWIKEKWSAKYGAGSFEHGVNFSEPKASEDGGFAAGSVARVRGYLMKYLAKGLFSDKQYRYTIGGRRVVFSMPLYELLFNSLLKKHKVRLWNCSRNFSAIMKRPETEGGDWECTEVSQYKAGDLLGVVWSSVGGVRPSFVSVWKEFCSWVNKPCVELYTDRGYKIEHEPMRDKNKWVCYEHVYVPIECV